VQKRGSNSLRFGKPSVMRRVWVGGAMGIVVLLSLLAAAHAEAAFSQPPGPEGVFGGVREPPPPSEFPEEEQLGGVGGLAVNYTGAGGVPKGTVYAATRGPSGGTLRVAEYRPYQGPLEEKHPHPLEFALGWEVRRVEGEYERCGPQAEEALHPECPTRVEATAGHVDVDVDQATGNVYVFSVENLAAGDGTVVEFDPNGTEVIARFGELAAGGKKTSETPSLVHGSPSPGGMAVNGAGEVFVFDLNAFDNFYHRLMVFRPETAGKFDEYEYAGEIAAGFQGEGRFSSLPVADAAGHLYVAGENFVQELAAQAPEAYPAAHPAPACSFEYQPGGITAMTVDPASGEPFFFTAKKEAGAEFKRIHELSACNGEGKFLETGKLDVNPERDDLSAMAFDPVRQLTPERKPGTLYATAPRPEPPVGNGQPGMGSLGYIFVQAAEDPPTVEGESVLRVGETFAEVSALVNTKSHPTTYFFEYLSEGEYLANGESFEGPNEARRAPAGGGDAGAGAGPVTIGATLTGLSPGTGYRFRVRLTNHCKEDPEILCEGSGEAVSFRTFSGLGGALPENRAYELVSPAQKNGGQVLAPEPGLSSCIPEECKPGAAYQHFPMQSAPDGEAVVYEGTPFSSSEGAVIENEYLARRTSTGWQSTNLTPSLLASKGGQGYKAFQGTLASSIIEQLRPSLAPGAPAGYANLYLQPSTAPGSLTPLISEANASLSCAEGEFALAYAGASPDFARHFFQADDALTPEATGACGETNVYEWSGGQLRALNVLPGEAESAPGAVLGSGDLLENSTAGNPPFIDVFAHAIAAGGNRVFWTAPSGALYVHLAGAETVEVPGPGSCRKAVPRTQRACFLTASADGTEVLLSNGVLYRLNGSGAYEEALDLSAGKGGFLGIVGQGEEDLTHLYFVDTEVLAGENAAHQSPAAGKDNLYALAGGETSFIATLASSDNQDWMAVPTLRTAEASRSGRWLAFLSHATPTGYDNVGPCAGNPSVGLIEPGPCAEAYLYDSQSAQLRCASCNPTEVPPLGRTALPLILTAPAAMGQLRYLTDSGRLFFDSRDSLVPSDTNGGVEDVYQFQPPGSDALGSCVLPGGCISLLSAGRGSSDSNFVAIDESGANVFFTSRDRLVPEDTDSLFDLYDARVHGGFPPASAPRECRAEACQPPQPPPAEALPNSSAAGPAETVKKHCKKGQVRRGGRCVAKHKHHKHKRKHRGKKAKQKRGGAK